MIQMIDFLRTIFPLFAGIFLGIIFFGGLWWTLQKSLASPYVAIWIVTSMLLRTGIVLMGFYYIGHGSWERMLCTLLGFFIVRLVVVHKRGWSYES